LRGLSQSDCEEILMKAGASHQQAKNGAYVYLHHGENLQMIKRADQTEYDKILDEFGAQFQSNQAGIRLLESLGFSYGQAKSAVYKYRKSRGLIRR
jgi:hypothetical protein